MRRSLLVNQRKIENREQYRLSPAMVFNPQPDTAQYTTPPSSHREIQSSSPPRSLARGMKLALHKCGPSASLPWPLSPAPLQSVSRESGFDPAPSFETPCSQSPYRRGS